MFGWFKKDTAGKVLAPASGEICALEEVPDPVFSGKILGDGVAILPESGVITAPVPGKIVSIAETRHAFGILADDGAELLIHIGLNTVSLFGAGFTPLVQAGEQVSAGQRICRVDLDYLARRGCSSHVITLLTNMDGVSRLDLHLGRAKGGKTCIMEYGK